MGSGGVSYYFGYLVPDIRPHQGVPCDCDFSVGSDKILRASILGYDWNYSLLLEGVRKN